VLRATCTLAVVLALFAAASVAGARVSDPSPLDGRWKIAYKATTEQLVAHGMWPSAAEALARLDVRIPAIDLRAGHARWFDLATGKTDCTGTYVVHGDVVGLAFTRCPVPAIPGVTWMRWRVFRDRVTFTPLPGRGAIVGITISSWIRVG
jgi:hypothetical protein